MSLNKQNYIIDQCINQSSIPILNTSLHYDFKWFLIYFFSVNIKLLADYYDNDLIETPGRNLSRETIIMIELVFLINLIKVT